MSDYNASFAAEVVPEVKTNDEDTIRDAVRRHLRAALSGIRQLETSSEVMPGASDTVRAVARIAGVLDSTEEFNDDEIVRVWWYWEEIGRVSPVQAAAHALKVQRDVSSIATVFEVEGLDGIVQVDFDPES